MRRTRLRLTRRRTCGRFWPKALITVNPHFERGLTVEALVRGGSLHPDVAFRVLKKNEIARFGEYRTARLVLAASDALAAAAPRAYAAGQG